MAANDFMEGSMNYEHTVSRIVNEGFRFSKEISPEIYRLYREWIENKRPENRTKADKEYLKLYASLPKKKPNKTIQDQESL